MKRILMASFYVCVISIANAQYDTLLVSDSNAILLVFDRDLVGEFGNNDYEVVVNGNRIKLYALKKNAKNSFLSVSVEGGGEFYFMLKYSTEVEKLIYNFTEKTFTHTGSGKEGDNKFSSVKTRGIEKKDIEGPGENQIGSMDTLKVLTKLAMENKDKIDGYAVMVKKMGFWISNIYVYGEYFFFKLGIRNDSNVNYNLGFFDLISGDKKDFTKKEASGGPHRLEILKVYPEIELPVINKGEEYIFVVVTKVEITNKNEIIKISANEINRGRRLEFDLPGKRLLKAKILGL